MRTKSWLMLAVIMLALFITSCGSSTETTTVASSPKPTATATPAAKPTPQPTATPKPRTVAGLPLRLKIPAINVDAPVETVGILPNGEMATPVQNKWEGVGWYDSGFRPGEDGTAIMAGHLDRPGGSPAVFWDLNKLRPGDKVTVTDDKGKTYTFQVERVVSYPVNQAPKQEIFGVTGGKGLNLITCAGIYDPNIRLLTERLVAYTKLVS